METINKAKIENVETNIGIHSFTTTVAESLIKFEVIRFKDSIFLWIGEKRNRCFGDLSLALISRCTSEPVCTKIMGHSTDLTSNNIASKLSKRLGKPVYVSFNLANDRLTISVVNKRIAEEIQRHPNFF